MTPVEDMKLMHQESQKNKSRAREEKESRHSDWSAGCRFVLGPAPCSKGSLLGPPSRLGHNRPGYRIHHLKSHQIFSGEKEVKSSVLKQKRILPRSTDWLNKARGM